MSTSRILVSLLLAAALAACGDREQAAPAATADTAAAATTPAQDVAPADAAAVDSADAAVDPAANADAEAATPAPAATPPQGPAPVEGTDYVTIANGQPFQPLNGQVEVVEVFGYTCPACAAFEPQFSAWKKRQPADVRVTPLAAPFGGFWMPYARAFYTAESMGLIDRTHGAMFEAIHVQRSLPVQNVSDQQIAGFYANHGADAAQFASTMQSFTVNAKLKRAEQFIGRTGVDATPTLVVNGKYRVIGGRSFDDVLNTVEHLVAQERGAR
ncbi:thiol:disulfide interchange protein DsbA/DsbL [Luteimonas yindakuii]|uniref:Thiol:disulfide interchange protein DsbA n=1 Tax=Luteimonas yindakuii TaxID=2565782 RepID=A0A4Z1R0S2_9GAMM|nr:thiol:disulfide interchange protein DsbA/DsbL [Luteimonas yindakuii]TKS53082.1 thiol:disulfide interchange protein DsbA/DsbL [Luteimonas yindakuii]